MSWPPETVFTSSAWPFCKAATRARLCIEGRQLQSGRENLRPRSGFLKGIAQRGGILCCVFFRLEGILIARVIFHISLFFLHGFFIRLRFRFQFGFNCLEPLIDGFNRSEQLSLQSFRFILRRLFYFIRWRCCAWFFHMHMDMLTIRRFGAFVLNLFKRLLKFLLFPRHKEFAQLVCKAVPRAFVISHMPISY